MRMCARVCVHICVSVYVRAYMCVCVYMHASVYVCSCAWCVISRRPFVDVNMQARGAGEGHVRTNRL